MSEAKGDDDEEFLAQLPQVNVLRVDISPNPTHISDELNLEVDFTVSKDVLDGWWEVQYLVDSVLERHIIKLGKVEPQDYLEGENHFQFSVPQINVASIKPSNLANCGLLTASFKTRTSDIMDLKMVVQVSKQGDSLQRIIYNPLEYLVTEP
ncbi:hypothetical protein H310_07012 [Aphanomyces invadans]|uniref:Uncharacterized protein n=1 Tax=Aphanomyces invadans TaxID=157072 RepID=A0A024U3B2_9STRA|nr:hypothetical protein H310_07012 [Aphanomyces invadans]ETW00367.1 hypothetical protein H310_07012 [Aphanomyces invadans]|eukprot:XP_008870502.1 hypothetical protein H310_07012 [Aphanomyces invadans]